MKNTSKIKNNTDLTVLFWCTHTANKSVGNLLFLLSRVCVSYIIHIYIYILLSQQPQLSNMLDPASEDEIDFSDDEELEHSSVEDEDDESEEDKEDELRKEKEKEKDNEMKDKEKKQPEVSSNQFLIREGYTTEHRVAIMNREVKYLMSLGKHEAALPVCTEAIQLNQSPLSYLNRAHIYKALKRYEEAIVDFTTVIDNDTLNTAASLCQRGICYSKLLDYDSAIENLNQSYQVYFCL